MNRQQILALVTVVGLSFGLFAYMRKQSNKIQAMDYEFENVRVRGIGSDAITFSFDLVLENTSDLDLKIYNIDFDVLWNNQKVGSGGTRDAYLVAKRSTQVVPLTLTLTRSELTGALNNTLGNLQSFMGGVVKIEGKMDVGADFLKIKDYAFDYEETARNIVGGITSIIR